MATRSPHPYDAATCWMDESGVMHICESAVPLRNERLIWTLCDLEVESGAVFAPPKNRGIICSKCIAADGLLKQRAESAHHEPALP